MCQGWLISVEVNPNRHDVDITGSYCQSIKGEHVRRYVSWATVTPPSWWERRQGLTWPKKVKRDFGIVLNATTRERDLHKLQLLTVANMCKMAGVETMRNRVLGAHVRQHPD